MELNLSTSAGQVQSRKTGHNATLYLNTELSDKNKLIAMKKNISFSRHINNLMLLAVKNDLRKEAQND